MTRTGRRPFAIANWKMAMTVEEALDFARHFPPLVGSLPQRMDIVICPPYTSLYLLAQALRGSGIALGGQNLYPGPGAAFTGEISAELLRDVGCQWVLLGHWERRRHFGETDELVNRKVLAALGAGLRPILLIGEPTEARERWKEAVAGQLWRVLAECRAEAVAGMAFVYEPEWAIGVREPAPPERVQAGCGYIRAWLEERFGAEAATAARIIYGGSVTPDVAADLLSGPEVDGLGAGRKGRDARAFAAIVQAIARAKELTSG